MSHTADAKISSKRHNCTFSLKIIPKTPFPRTCGLPVCPRNTAYLAWCILAHTRFAHPYGGTMRAWRGDRETEESLITPAPLLLPSHGHFWKIGFGWNGFSKSQGGPRCHFYFGFHRFCTPSSSTRGLIPLVLYHIGLGYMPIWRDNS